MRRPMNGGQKTLPAVSYLGSAHSDHSEDSERLLPSSVIVTENARILNSSFFVRLRTLE
jgi:hypothetical protein